MTLELTNEALYWDTVRSIRCLFSENPVYYAGGSMAKAQKRYYEKKKEAILARMKKRYDNDEDFRQKQIARTKDWQARKKKSELLISPLPALTQD